MRIPLLTLTVFLAVNVVAGDTKPFLKANWDTARLRGQFRGRVAHMMLSYWVADRNSWKGLGKSDGTTSGELAWGESVWLRNYVMCYRASHDTYWLDKVVDHFDRMLGKLDDHDGDGFLAWHDRKYSVGLVRVISRRKADGLEISPEASKLWVKSGGDKVTGHNYSITFPTPDTVEIRDETEKKKLASRSYKGKITLTDIPGAKFTITGSAEGGARFDLDSVPGEECEYQVHDGMITYPIAEFIEIVFNDPQLHAKYKAKADEYLAFIDKHVRRKWERTWVEVPDGCGAYRFTSNVTQRYPDALLPHNQYLALARTFLVLKDVEGVPDRQVYLEKAAKMARYFKKNLHLNGNAYVWNYWDPYPAIPDIHVHVEDVGHGSIDIGFAVEACNRNVVFTAEDLVRFSHTYADVMWNQSRDDPIIAGRVDGKSTRRDGRATHEWIKLAQWNPKVWDIAALIYDKSKSSGHVPSMLYMLAGLAGIDDAELGEYRRMKRMMEQAFEAGTPVNGGFETAGVGEDTPFGWSLSIWSKGRGRMARVKGGHESAHSVMLQGLEAPVNLVAFPVIRTPVAGPTRFRATVYYRTEGDAVPKLSFCGHDCKTGRMVQYLHSNVLPKSADWTKTEWQVTSEPGIMQAFFVLRNHGLGKVFYDDFRMEKIPE